MAVKTVTRKRFQLTCEVCQHQWESDEKPVRCAKCKTPYWDRKKNGDK